MLSELNRVAVDCKTVVTIFETILDFIAVSRKFPGLPYWNESRSKPRRKNPAEDEPSRLDTNDLPDPSILIPSRQLIGQTSDSGWMLQQSGDVIEENTGLWKVRHFADKRLIVDSGHEI
jgi:hypothetical protein